MSASVTNLTCVRQAHKEQTYEEFLEARKAGFGGSDVGDLLDSEPYGCKRRLFLDRLGLLPAGGDDRLRYHLERGKFFEAPVAELYAQKTGRMVKPTGTGYIKQHPFVRANADRLTSREIGPDGGRGWGVLEIKVPGAWSFRKIKKDGLPEAYVLQVQWQMLCYGTSWGSVAVYWPDGHELLWFDVERDDELCAMLLERGRIEWKWLETFKEFVKSGMSAGELFQDSAFPAAKPEAHTSCSRCPAFELCHAKEKPESGSVLDLPELQVTAAAYAQVTDDIKRLEKLRDEYKQEIKDEFAKMPVEEIRAGDYSITLSERTRESIDTAKLKKDLPKDQLVRYMKQTEYEVLTVKQKKG